MKNKETEMILLNDENYEKFIRKKTEAEFNAILDSTKNQTKKIVTDIKQIPPNMIFSKNAIFLVINKNCKTKSYINGLQAEGFITSNSTRKKLLEGNVDYFVNGDNYIKFYKIKLCANS